MQNELNNISRRAAEISQRLHDRALSSEGILWLAVDGANDNADPLPESLATVLEGNAAMAVPLSHPQIDKSWRPKWVRLDTSTSSGSFLVQDGIEHALRELQTEPLRRGAGRTVAGWIQLDGEDPQTALAHLARQMIRPAPGGSTRLVRLHDPAVMWALWPLLDVGQQRDLLGPIRSWTILGPTGYLTVLHPVGDQATLPWSPHLWQDVDDITSMNAAFRAVDLVPVAALQPTPCRPRVRAKSPWRRCGALEQWGFRTRAIWLHLHSTHLPCTPGSSNTRSWCRRSKCVLPTTAT